ncbi:zeatin O-glucosyltransferase-like [Solanum dulcamara]|uniref:zeatin O-glucosyltransferase-like n=1 Tax=Solanum dulcamara TaxID=45834 RepID=UPI0024861D6F|nr:zeatin O-glucosyltransferase-like [Solanum dulcamara]
MATNSSTTILQLNEVIVAVIPWPEYGHINPLFHIANFISSHNIPLHFISLIDRNQDLKNRAQNTSKIHFNDLLAPPLTQISEPRKDFADEFAFLEFLDKLGEPIYEICVEISKKAKKLVVIFDSLMTNVIKEVYSISNVECYSFHVISAFCMYSTFQQIVGEVKDGVARQVFDEMPEVEDCFGPDIFEFVKKERECNLNCGEFMNSCRELEGEYLDLLVKFRKKPLFGLGPFHMLQELPESSGNRSRHECVEFLDEQDVNSVMFVSFGTTTTLSREQMNELALGLEKSNHKFIWVIREADKKMETDKCGGKDWNFELPEGFEERVEGRGMVVRNWVPQMEILGHKSTGGFLSHCGWNSCMESISMGVPIATWPIQVDQPYNAVFVTNVLKIGIPVRSWARREELVTATTIEKAVRTLMGTPEGVEIRQRAMELSNKIKNSVSHGGLAHKERESFITCITK